VLDNLLGGGSTNMSHLTALWPLQGQFRLLKPFLKKIFFCRVWILATEQSPFPQLPPVKSVTYVKLL
jgi:hypothetical protein